MYSRKSGTFALLYAKINVKSNHFLFLTSLESPLNKGGSEGVWKYRWLPVFSLAFRDAGTKTKLASSLLIMTIVGGAVAPVIMGYIADTTGSMAIAFLIPLVCYGVIGGYALLKPSASL